MSGPKCYCNNLSCTVTKMQNMYTHAFMACNTNEYEKITYNMHDFIVPLYIFSVMQTV